MIFFLSTNPLSSANPATVGQSVVFTATVTGGTIKPTGTVNFVDITNNNALLGNATINATTGIASVTIGNLSAGLREIAVFYGGDSRYAVSGASIDQVVNAAVLASTIRISAPAAIQIVDVVMKPLEVKAFPNPSSNFFNVTITGKNNSPVNLRVTDILGRVVVIQKVGANSTLRMGQKWTGGIYFIEVMQDNERKMIKVIKAN